MVTFGSAVAGSGLEPSLVADDGAQLTSFDK